MICVGHGNHETLADVSGGTYCLLIIIYEFSYHREHTLHIYEKDFMLVSFSCLRQVVNLLYCGNSQKEDRKTGDWSVTASDGLYEVTTLLPD